MKGVVYSILDCGLIDLKRFAGLRFRSKLDTPVSIPLELEMEPFLVNKSGMEIFVLWCAYVVGPSFACYLQCLVAHY